jgi:hypothetical protein
MEDGPEHRASIEKVGVESSLEKDIKEGYTFQAEGMGDKISQVEFELDGELVNASGHKDQLRRQYGIWRICSLALTIDNAWVVLGGSIAIAISKPRLICPVTSMPGLTELQTMEDLLVSFMNS